MISIFIVQARVARARRDAPKQASRSSPICSQELLVGRVGDLAADHPQRDVVAVGVVAVLPVDRHSAIGLTTVYRALAALAEGGLVDTVRDVGGERLYRHRPGSQHRHYLICRRCGRSEPIDTTVVEDWAEQLARRTGYTDVRHTLELDGICATCQHAAR